VNTSPRDDAQPARERTRRPPRGDGPAERPGRSAAVIYPSQVFVGATLVTLGPLLDPILRDLHIPLADAGLLSFGFFLGRVCGVLLLNFGLARVPIKRIMVLCAVFLALGSTAAGLLGVGLWPLIVSLFVTGLAGVIPNSISGVWVAAHVRQGLERAMINIGAYFAVGVVVAPLVIGGALQLGATWRQVFLGQAVFGAMMAVVLAILPIADVPERENLRGTQLKAVVSSQPKLLAVMLVSTFLYVCVEGTLYTWLAKLHVDLFHAGPEVAALSVTLFWGGITVGRYIAASLTRFASAARLLAVFAFLLAVFVGAVALAPNLAVSEVFSFLAGFGASACWPLVSCYTPRFPGWQAGVVFSGMMLVGTVANTVSPYLFGPAVGRLGFRAAMGLWVIPILAVVALAFLLERTARDSERTPAAAPDAG
jgi:MFS transporter, FHS family, glucose/mannose:H+ symporter